MELAALVSGAYAQYSAFEDDAPWALPKGYELVRELKYAYGTRNPWDKASAKLDKRLKSGVLPKKTFEIPIGFVARRGRTAFVIFRGTKTTKEWINNFNTKLQECFIPQYGNVHEGFHGSYLALRKTLADAVESMGAREYLIGGHSLGAAFGTFALLDLALILKKKVKALYTFGSPRVGDNSFVRSFNADFGARSFRVANTSDIVPSIPLPIPLAGIVGGYFSHVDTPVDFTLQADDVELNHAMDAYRAALESQVKKGFLTFMGRAFRRKPFPGTG